MNRRERVFAVAFGRAAGPGAGGLLDKFFAGGLLRDEAVKTHIRYFEETQTDICKIMRP